MAHETLAPWAEKVEGVGPMTADELFNLPEDPEWQYELVDGVLVRMPSPGYQHGKIVARLIAWLTSYVDAHRLGDVLGADAGFLLSQLGQSDTVLGPDISFVQAARAPAPTHPTSHATNAWRPIWSSKLYRPANTARRWPPKTNAIWRPVCAWCGSFGPPPERWMYGGPARPRQRDSGGQ